MRPSPSGSRLDGLRIGVLGGTRFIGVHLVEALLEGGARVSILHRGKTAEPRPFRRGVERFHGDRDRPESLSAFFADAYDAVFDVSGYTPRQVEPVIARWRGKIGHYLFCSTTSVYGASPPPGFDEHAPRPPTPGTYGGEKALAEDALLEAGRRHGWPVTVLRPQFVFGRLEAPAALYILRRLAAGRPVLIRPQTAGKRVKPLAVEDLVEAFLLALGNPNARGQAYNVAGAQEATPESLGRALEGIARAGAFRPVLLEDAVARRFPDLGLPWPAADFLPSTEKLVRDLGARSTTLDEALRRTWDWCRSERACLRLTPQRWESRAPSGRLPSALTELGWRVYDGLKTLPLYGLARSAATSVGLRSRYS